MVGKTITHYKIIEKLGEGGMGEVYLADDTKLKRQVAIKFLPSRISINETDKSRFLQEAQAAAAINHPNVCVIYEIQDQEESPFIVMEYIEGQTLSDKISSDSLPMDQVIEYAVQISEALKAAHDKGIVHRDVKSDNIMISATNQVKVMDFGLAKLRSSVKLTKTTSTIGTLAYMSPEQIEGKDIDARSDIFSFGVVLYEMLAGRRPFQGEYESALMYSILNEEPEPVIKFRSDLSSDLIHVLNRLLEKNPEDRYHSMKDVLIELKRLKRDSSKISHITIPIDKTCHQEPKVKKKINLNILIPTLVIILVTIFVIFFLEKDKNNQISYVQTRHIQLTFTGKAYNPEISPDGSQVAYIIDRDSVEQKVLVQDVKGGKPLPVFKGKVEKWTSIRWTPDGSKISFPASKDGIKKIYLLPRMGGESRQLEYYDCHTWSPNGEKMACTAWSSNKIWIVDVESGDTRSITLDVDLTYMWAIDWSPDDRYLLCTTFTVSTYTIWIIKIDGSGQRKIIESSVIDWPRWGPNGEAIYYRSEVNNTADLCKINFNPVSGETIGSPIILQSGLNLSVISISADNKKLLTTKQTVHSNIYAFQRTDNGYSTKPLTSGTSFISSMNISPDGKNIIFDREGNIYIIPSSGGTPKQLTFNQQQVNMYPVWSPDGTEIAYFSISGQDNKAKVWRMKSTGGTPKPVKIVNFNTDSKIYWAPGNDILYQNLDGTNFYLHNRETGKERAIGKGDSSIRMWWPCYSPDLNKISVNWEFNEQGRRKLGLWIISLNDSAITQISDEWLFPIAWSLDGNWIYFSDSDNPSNIRMINVKTGKVKPFYKLPINVARPYEIFMTPDARFIAAIVENRQTDILMLEDFDPDVE